MDNTKEYTINSHQWRSRQ